MGNCFGKSSNSETEAFAQPGRRLDETPSPTRSTPSKRSTPAYKISSHGQPLGGSNASSDAMEARRAAARAAEERAAAANRPKGKLGQALANQKQQTRTTTLGEASREERRQRDAVQGAETRNYN